MTDLKVKIEGEAQTAARFNDQAYMNGSLSTYNINICCCTGCLSLWREYL